MANPQFGFGQKGLLNMLLDSREAGILLAENVKSVLKPTAVQRIAPWL